MGVTTLSPPQVAPPILSKLSTLNRDYSTSSSSPHLQQSLSYSTYYYNNPSKPTNNYQYSMSQDYHHHHQQQQQQQANAFTFSNGFGRTQQVHQEDPPVYEAAGMLSEMFNFPPPPPPGTTSAGDLLMTRQQLAVTDWYTNRHQQGVMGPFTNDQSSKTDHINGINADSAAAMQLFLMNPHHQNPRSPSPAPSTSNNPSSSTLHMLLPNPSGNGGAPSFGGPPQFTWFHDNEAKAATGMGRQGLSLSLSSHLEAAKAERFLYGAPGGVCSSSSGPHHQIYQPLHLQGGLMGQTHHHNVGFGVAGSVGNIVKNSSSSSSSSIGVVNVLRSSKYVKAAQELLEEFCSVGRGQLKRNKLVGKSNGNPSSSTNNNNNNNNNDDNPPPGNGPSSSSTKDIPPLSAADKIEHQRRKVKLVSMLDEVDRRYNHYCEQMQMVVNSFDLVMGFGSAVPYTALAQKAMSRHFRCLKDAIVAQLKHSCDLLGEKDASGSSGITKGETPRLKMLEQSLRQQRAFHQMGMMEQEAWRPQRGLPERSVNLLRAWLFEHFLHPYPSDADKHLLARQTGLSRNQVSNWFINARVRLWKPMVEEMYQREPKDEDSASEEKQTNSIANNNSGLSQTPPHTTTTSSPPPTSTFAQFNANIETDPSLFQFADNFATTSGIMDDVAPPYHDLQDDTCQRGGIIAADGIIRFGINVGAGGDVSLTLGLRHAGNTPEKGSGSSPFTVRDFGGC